MSEMTSQMFCHSKITRLDSKVDFFSLLKNLVEERKNLFIPFVRYLCTVFWDDITIIC